MIVSIERLHVHDIRGLADARRDLRAALVDDDVDERDADDFVLAVHEAVVAALEIDGDDRCQISVTWARYGSRRMHLVGQISVVSAHDIDYQAASLRNEILNSLSDRIQVNRLIGGSVTEVHHMLHPPG